MGFKLPTKTTIWLNLKHFRNSLVITWPIKTLTKH